MTKPLAIFPTRTTAAPGIEVITARNLPGVALFGGSCGEPVPPEVYMTATYCWGEQVTATVLTYDKHAAIDAHLDAILAVRQASVRLVAEVTAADPDVIATTTE